MEHAQKGTTITLSSFDFLIPGPTIIRNLILAIIPVACANIGARIMRSGDVRKKPVRLVGVVVILLIWAAFLPNTCYLVTEWRHYVRAVVIGELHRPAARLAAGAPIGGLGYSVLAGETCFYAVYSSFGLLTFFLSVWPIDRIIRSRSRGQSICFKLILFTLSSVGVYLGLIYRFNTWDLIRPHRLFTILRIVSRSAGHPLILGTILVCVVMLWLAYSEVFEVWMDGRLMRKTRAAGDKAPV